MKYQLHFDHKLTLSITLIMILVLWYLVDDFYRFIISSSIMIVSAVIGLLLIDHREKKWDEFTRDYYG